MRTKALLGHAMKCAGLFENAGSEKIEIPSLSTALSQCQWTKEAARQLYLDDGVIDAFGEKRLARWITGRIPARRNLKAVLNAWEGGRYVGSTDAFHHGPAKSLLFDALAAPIEAEMFYRAADIDFESLCDQIATSNRLSGHVRVHLDEMGDAKDSRSESAMKYLATSVAWFRYASITLHSIDYILDHLNRAMKLCDSIERRVLIGENGAVSYPINMNEFSIYLIQMTRSSMRFAEQLKDSPAPLAGSDVKGYWREVSKKLVRR
ncbi:MAG: hypothetical protein WC736_16575 [Gallionella sp.]|jgi:hypothetical protein